MGTLGNRALFEPLRSIDSATFTGSYQKLGTATTNPAVLIKVVNNSAVLVTVSYDGVADHDILPGSSFYLYDFGSDAESASSDKRLFFGANTQVWVKGAASTGLVYLVVMYQGFP